MGELTMIISYIFLGFMVLYSIFLICDNRPATIDDCLIYYGVLLLELGITITG